jgi:hypothetical protein
MALIIAAATAMAAGLMRGFAGFGPGMLMAPIFAILFGPVVLLAVLASMAMLALPVVVRAALLTPAYLPAAWIGSGPFRHSNEVLYRRTAIFILLGVGLFGLLR